MPRRPRPKAVTPGAAPSEGLPEEARYQWHEIANGALVFYTRDFQILVAPRPVDDPRGTHTASAFAITPAGHQDRDHQFPRFYFGRDVAQQQMEAWLRRRGQLP
jgi:hypothetical protein